MPEESDQSRKKKYTYFIGIDVSKNELDYAVMKGSKLVFHREGRNRTDDVLAFCDALKKELPGFKIPMALFCMEQSGLYCNPSLLALRKLRANVACQHPLEIKRSMGMVRGKDDKADAIRIAAYAQNYKDRLRLWVPRRPVINELMHMVTLRNRLLSVSIKVDVPLKEQEKFIEKRLQKKVKLLCKKTRESAKADMFEVEQSIERLIQGDKHLKRLKEVITSVKSIGDVTAIQIIIATNEFRDIKCPKKFACYAGVAPFKTESGMVIKKARVSPIADRKIKSLLHICALNAIRNDKELSAYYERKTKMEGKPKMAVVNAVRYKLILRVFACLKQDRTFIIDYDRPPEPIAAMELKNIISLEI